VHQIGSELGTKTAGRTRGGDDRGTSVDPRPGRCHSLVLGRRMSASDVTLRAACGIERALYSAATSRRILVVLVMSASSDFYCVMFNAPTS